MANPNSKYTPAQFSEILLKKSFGLNCSEIARETGYPKAMVTFIARIFDAIKDSDWVDLVKACEQYRMSPATIQWVANQQRKAIPDDVMERVIAEMSGIRKRSRQKAAEKAKKQDEPAPVAEAPVVEQPVVQVLAGAEDHWEDQKLYLTAILKELQKNNELLEQLYDVVFPKWTSDLKDNLNCNFDVIGQSMKRCEDKLEGIKINTRRKGL